MRLQVVVPKRVDYRNEIARGSLSVLHPRSLSGVLKPLPWRHHQQKPPCYRKFHLSLVFYRESVVSARLTRPLTTRDPIDVLHAANSAEKSQRSARTRLRNAQSDTDRHRAKHETEDSADHLAE